MSVTDVNISQILKRGRASEEEALALACSELSETLLAAASELRNREHGDFITYSRNVFIPLTNLCRDVCHYCSFTTPPRAGHAAYMSMDEVLAVAEAGAKAGCTEILFTLGDKPELRYQAARTQLDQYNQPSTLSYLAEVARRVMQETGLLPHINPGVIAAEDLQLLRQVSASQGLMLESAAERLCQKGGPHYGSPDKDPQARLETIRLAGEHAIPYTSGILVGIGETRKERIESLLRLRELHDRYGHIQEIIIQNFRAKPGTKMSNAPEPSLDEQLWTIAIARLVFGGKMSIQVPPNLHQGIFARFIEAGINDWGGVSPVTPDYVNPEAPWPQLEHLAAGTDSAGKTLVERTAVYPEYIFPEGRWLDPELRNRTLAIVDAQGYVRTDPWSPGMSTAPPEVAANLSPSSCQRIDSLSGLIAKASKGNDLDEAEVIQLFNVRGSGFDRVRETADQLRQEVNGDTVSYVVNRNINYTNVCYFHCGFCAFSKGKTAEKIRGRAYNLEIDEILQRTQEAKELGATEVCLQGGIHPHYTGETYLQICRAINQAFPDIHIHAFSALEVHQGAETLGISVRKFLSQLRDAGLHTLPGTAAEILDDEVRAQICPDKVTTKQWLDIMQTAHEVGLSTTSTIMYGHVDRPWHWARHLLHIRNLQKQTGGFNEFVPLPFVHMEAPIFSKGGIRKGPSFREAVLMHSVARLVLHPFLTNIQTSWTKMGTEGAKICLQSGANDLGGTLMDENISRAAGAQHGEEMSPREMESLINSIGRTALQRSTTYAPFTREIKQPNEGVN
ncbi:MAG: 5-amino-6-(D-ribitylamino)uracil--L-tyrosine 4-hydroxyphenyl transferase CofH [Gammaproteobacteria bacterium]|nr:5-amino-6-(D-ribitylamino)uracil--L-tyrosine 4-hydroxyphenyl transferase CofH [Gammaproteobacteria bacterium]